MRTSLLMLILGINFSGFAQIGGISASKLTTLCTQPVPVKAIEFEPTFGFSYSNEMWNETGKLIKTFETKDSVATSSKFGFRFSYGAIKNLEIGLTLPVDISSINCGMKYKLPFGNKVSFALLTGFNFPVGNQILSKNYRRSENTATYIGGLIMTYNFNEKLSIDADAQYQKYIKNISEKHKNDIFINTEIGYFIADNIQFVIGLNNFFTTFENSNSNSFLISLNPGITIERAENFILVLNTPIDLTGKNTDKTAGFGLALTININ